MQKVKGKDFQLLIYLLILSSIAGASIIYLATYRFGPGLSTDAVLNLSATANIMHGRGFVDLYGTAMIQWPPLYAILLAMLSRITGVDIFLIGWHLNAIVFGLIVFFSGILFYKTYPERPIYAYLGSMIVLTSIGIIQISANIASDPLFLLFVVMFLVSAKYFIDTQKLIHLWLMALLACLASFQRYAGLALALTGSLFLLYYYRSQLVKALLRSSAFFLLSGLPIIGWGVFHNYPLSGKLFGSNQVTSPLGDLYIFIEKFLYWFLPYSIIRIATPIGLLIAIILILVLINRQPAHWKNWFNRLASDSQMANLIFTLIYGGMLIFYVSYFEHQSLESQRIHVVILPSLLIIIFAAMDELIPPRSDSPNNAVKYRILAILFIIWLIYPVSKIQDYLQKSLGADSSSNNIYNKASLRESSFLVQVQTLSTAHQKIYSNYQAPAWFYLRTDVMSLPKVDKKGEVDSTDLAEFQQSIGTDGGGYIVWFRTFNFRENVPETSQLYQMAKIEPVFISNIGDIYHIVSGSP